MTALPVGYDLAGALMGLELPRAVVERAHLAAQKALLAEGFAIRRELPVAQDVTAHGYVLSAGALACDRFTGREMLLRTDLFMTTDDDSYGCAYLSWDIRHADEGPRQSGCYNETLGLRHVWEGRGVDPRMPAFEAQKVLLGHFSAALSGPEAVDFDALAADFAKRVGLTLTL